VIGGAGVRPNPTSPPGSATVFIYLYFFFVICLLWFSAVNKAGYPLTFSARSLLVSHRVVVIFTSMKEVMFTSPPSGVRRIAMSMHVVCLFVCLSARKSQNTHVQTSQTFPVYVACGRLPLTKMQYIVYFRFSG